MPIFGQRGRKIHERETARASNGSLSAEKIRPKEGDPMDKLIRRLMACGMTAKVALSMLRKFSRKQAELYVEEIEEASREQMETV